MIMDYMHCYGRTLAELQADVMEHIKVGGWQPIGGVFQWVGANDAPPCASLWQTMVLLEGCQRQKEVERLKIIVDQLDSIQSLVYKQAVANMKWEDTKQAYNMLGEAQIAINGAIARLEL